MPTTRSYSELLTIPTFEDRFRYLSLRGEVGDATFGFDRWINQQFYRSREWMNVRQYIIARDLGGDLAIQDRQIRGRIIVHHMLPMTPDDIVGSEDSILNPEFLISTSHNTHNAIHYGDEKLLQEEWKPRTPDDTVPWRRR